MPRRSFASWSQYRREAQRRVARIRWMTHACPITAATEHGVHRVGKPLEAVADDEEHIAHAAVLQIGQHVHPELRRLATTGAGPQPEDVSPTVEVDADRGVERPVADLAVADLDVDSVDENRRVDRRKRPTGPGLHLLHHPIGDPTDRVLAD